MAVELLKPIVRDEPQSPIITGESGILSAFGSSRANEGEDGASLPAVARGGVLLQEKPVEDKPDTELNFTFGPFNLPPRIIRLDGIQALPIGGLIVPPSVEKNEADKAVVEPDDPATRFAKARVERAREIIRDNSAIADFSFVSSEAMTRAENESGRTVEELVAKNINDRLTEPELATFFDKAFFATPSVEELYFGAERKSINSLDENKTALSRLKNPAELMPAFFKEVFADESNGLLKDWMKAVDSLVSRSSEVNLSIIDNAKDRGEVVKKDVVIVGGGPLTSLLASILGPYRNVTVITDQNSIGKPWRNRPIFINSSTEVQDPKGPRLPLLEGSTTPVSTNQHPYNLDTDILLGEDVLEVACDDGSKRKYVSGIRVGELVATVIAQNADDYIVGQTVDPSKVQLDIDGTFNKRIEFIDKNGKKRQLDANTVIFAGGPGKEKSKLDKASQKAYDAAAAEVDKIVAESRKKVASIKEAYNASPEGLSWEEYLHKTLGNDRVANYFKKDLPKILTLTSIEKLYELWFEDLDSDRRVFPLFDIIETGTRTANIGGGDTTRVLEELRNGLGPKRAYPENYFPPTIFTAVSTLYNEPAFTPTQYKENNRRRYGEVYTNTTFSNPDKVDKVKTKKDQARVEWRDSTLANLGAKAKKTQRDYDYAFVATGIERPKVEEQLQIGRGGVFDDDGYQVALGNALDSLFVVGSAAGLKLQDFPRPIRNIINELGIPENTISLWVHGLLGERLGWRTVTSEGTNVAKVGPKQ